MKADEPETLERDYAALLAAREAELDSAAPGSSLQTENVSPEVWLDLEQDMACVKLLRQAFSPGDDTASSTTAPSTQGSSALPWSNLGRFQIRRELGRGTFGIVYLAYDPGLGREVALKIPRTDALADPDQRHRFQREARAAAGLDHPNLVPVYEAGEVGPVCYIASAYCSGITLAYWLKQRDEPVPYHLAAELISVLADAVDYAHQRGVVHRDLKPGNILLQTMDDAEATEKNRRGTPSSTAFSVASWQPKITDFGLAKFLLGEPGMSAATQTGAIVGTANYMAPEQAGGETRQVGTAADIYALGVILYELLTGRTPFQGDSVLEVLLRVRTEEPIAPGKLRQNVPRDLETICLKCLQKEPGKRYARASDLAQDLRHFLAGKPIQARPIGARERAVKWARRRPTAAALIAVSSLASVLLVAGLVAGIVYENLRRMEVEQTAYYNAITSALHEISAANWGPAEELLEDCPERLRDWEWHYLQRRCHTPPIDPLPMGEHVSMTTGFDLAFHPDSRLLAIPSAGNTIQVWDTSSGKKVATLRGHTGRILSVAFSPDGRRLASTSEDRNVMVWDVSTALEKGEVQEPLFRCPHEESVIGVAFSPDNQRLASASAETDKPGEAKVWDAASGKFLFSFPGQKLPNRLVHLTFSPNSHWLAAGSENNNVVVYDVTTHEKVCTLPGHTEPVLNVTFSPDGRRLISAGWDRLVKVWDLGDGARGVLSPRWTLHNFTTGAWGMALSPDGSRLAIGAQTADGNVRVYDLTTGQLLRTLRGDYRVISVAFSRDGRRLAAVGHDRVVRLWDVTTGREVLHLDGHDDIVGQVRFSPDGQRLATASADGTVRVWDASPFQNTDPHIRTLGGPDDGEFFGIDFSPDPESPLLASASADGSIKLWNILTRQVVHAFSGREGAAALCVAFQPRNGSLLVSGSMDHTVKLWDTSTRTEVRRPDLTSFKVLDPTSFKVMVRGVAFRPDGEAFATVSHQALQLWDARTGNQIFAQQVDQEHANGVAFSRDGRFLASVGHSGTAMVWDATGKQVSFFQGHERSVFCVAFHPEGEYLASGDSDRNVKLWKRATGEKICTLREHTDNESEHTHTDYVFGVAFSPDGKYLATASWKEVIVWDVSKLVKIAGVWDVGNLDKIKKKRTFDRIAGKILWVAFSADGKHLAAASGYKGRGEIKIWDSTLWDESAIPSP